MLGERSVRVALGVFGLGVLTAPAFAAWVITEMTPLPHWSGSMEATDINSSGVICGMGNYVVNASSTVFRYDGMTVTELPVLPDADVPIALATGINTDGVICGYSHEADGDSRACYWEGTSLTALPYPPDINTTLDFRAYAINDHDVIVGYYYSTNGASDVRTAFYYQNGTSYSLRAAIEGAGLTGGSQFATGINNHNVICGTADDAFGHTTPWTYDIDSGVLTLIPRFSDKDTSVADINESGKMQGRGELPDPSTLDRVLYYDGSVWHVVDSTVTHTQYAEAINDNGRMVGSRYNSGDRLGWYSDGPGDGSMILLDLPGWPSNQAKGINNDDVIVGYGKSPTSGSYDRGFVYAPPPGDTDHDGVIDLDCSEFAACLSGPAGGAGFGPPSAACLEAFDCWPRDGDVDLKDFAAFQIGFEGS